MSQKIKIFPVRADSAFRTDYSSIGTCKFIVGIYTKFKIDSGLDYTEPVHGLASSQLLLEKQPN